jgi:hypothetical protein
MGTPRILDEETRKQLLGYVPFSTDATIKFTPDEFKAVKDETLRPVFELRSFTQAEVIRMNKNSSGYLQKEITHEQIREIADKNCVIVSACMLGWSNLFDAGTGAEIEFKPSPSGGCDEKVFKQLPGWLQGSILDFVRHISGLSLAENLSLR